MVSDIFAAAANFATRCATFAGKKRERERELEGEVDEFLVDMCDDPAVPLSNGQTDIR